MGKGKQREGIKAREENKKQIRERSGKREGEKKRGRWGEDEEDKKDEEQTNGQGRGNKGRRTEEAKESREQNKRVRIEGEAKVTNFEIDQARKRVKIREEDGKKRKRKDED